MRTFLFLCCWSTLHWDVYFLICWYLTFIHLIPLQLNASYFQLGLREWFVSISSTVDHSGHPLVLLGLPSTDCQMRSKATLKLMATIFHILHLWFMLWLSSTSLKGLYPVCLCKFAVITFHLLKLHLESTFSSNCELAVDTFVIELLTVLLPFIHLL